jgi:3-oxoacyl-[acyl-carrier protein] reductase
MVKARERPLGYAELRVGRIVSQLLVGSARNALARGERSGLSTTYQVNIMPAARMMRLLLAAMKESGWGPTIFLVAPTRSRALMDLILERRRASAQSHRRLAKALGACGASANGISSGVILTPMVEHWLTDLRGMACRGNISQIRSRAAHDEADRSVVRGTCRLSRRHRSCVCVIARPAASHMTSAHIRVDGGRVQSVN